MTERSYTLRELQLLASGSVPSQVSLALIFAERAEDILAQVDTAIDHIAQDFARTPKERQGRSEDSLTIDVVTSLRSMGFQASHDTTVGGHCDVVIEGRNNFLWLGEAKIHRSYDWLLQGFNQLDSRYATASKYQDHGGIIIYCYDGRADKIMDEWAVRLKQARPDVEVNDRAHEELFFTSAHLHSRTGRPYRVRHVPIALQWKPAS
ncbi:hypothetical protein [Mesorhizobium sp. M0118]|uniref:hypothetical protein n=1 Tax=Mesorhizobium sp. M0118 TaxID=2956884 RepID=UPI00333529F9